MENGLLHRWPPLAETIVIINITQTDVQIVLILMLAVSRVDLLKEKERKKHTKDVQCQLKQTKLPMLLIVKWNWCKMVSMGKCFNFQKIEVALWDTIQGLI